MIAKSRIVVESNGTVLCTAEQELTIGTRTGCDVVVEDAVMADRHCRIQFDGTFHLRDLGSVTGTWLNGRRAPAFAEITDDCEIVIGTCRLVAKIAQQGGVASLTLDLQRGAFWWTKPGKGVFDNDPDAMVRSEVGFGRYPLLHLLNRTAAVAALTLLVAAILFASVFEPLVEAGPLAPAHRYVRDLAADTTGVHARVAKCAQIAKEQGCSACHERGNGTPMQKCMQCHDELQTEATRRHPFLGDGKLGALPAVDTGAGFCSICHRDHEGSSFLKAESTALVGKCETCHGDIDRNTLIGKAPLASPPPRTRPHSSIRFPHDRHANGMRCDVCHRPDAELLAARARGAADDPDRHDFAEVPFAVCATCHVEGSAPATGITADEQTEWRRKAKDVQWSVRWHGTDEGGKGCALCHARTERAGAQVFGPELLTVERPNDTVDEYAAQRATFVAGRRMHDDEFHAHAAGKQCLECHVRGSLAPGAAPRAATFWHALHLAGTALVPPAGNGGAVSRDAKAGCVSCHHERKQAKALRAAADGAFAWGADEASQAACKECHHDSGKANAMRATDRPVPADRRRRAVAFPHDAHVGSTKFGEPGTALAEGCFACHEFATPTGDTLVHAVPRVKERAADCTQCHAGHDNVGGGSCQQCHPKTPGSADSFALAARVADAALPARSWPAPNGFSHSSPGHTGTDLEGKAITCSVCHDEAATAAAKTLADTPVPDEGRGMCRACHVQRQFHWR